MPKIQLLVSTYPPCAETFARIRTKDGNHYTHITVVDTGAQISTFPARLLDRLEYRLSERGQVTIEQAGIAGQFFQATEAYVKVHLEDIMGGQTEELEILAWFTNTSKHIVGFGGVLERCVFHLDMPNLAGYLDFLS